MLTVTQLAKQFGISRTTILYYERENILLPSHRSDNGYRWYEEKQRWLEIGGRLGLMKVTCVDSCSKCMN